jgi:CheY-like chemotaxis protein
MMARPKIMVVDDEPRFLSNMLRLFRDRGLDVIGVGSGEAALEQVKMRQHGVDRENGADVFDVVFLDMKLPGMDGRATLEGLREAGCEAEIIVLTGHAAVDEAVEILNLGAFDYLLKPCRTETLMRMLELAFEKRGLPLT